MLSATPVPMPLMPLPRAPRPAAIPPSEARSMSAYVHPGRLVAAKDVPDFTTVVGSGAVVCIWDPVANVGGMAHFLLPEKGNAPAAPRFGDVALKQLVEELERLGAHRSHFRASVFGGSAPPIASESGHLGERNVKMALSFLATLGIGIVQKDVGGAGGRKVVFAPTAGTAAVVRLSA